MNLAWGDMNHILYYYIAFSSERTEKEISYKTLWTKIIWTSTTIFFASGLWDYFTAQYHAIFEVTFTTQKQQV